MRKCQIELKTLQNLTLAPDDSDAANFLTEAVAMWKEWSVEKDAKARGLRKISTV